MALDSLSPDEVLARCYTCPTLADELAEWCGGQSERLCTSGGTVVTTVWVPTWKGPRPAVLGDWIVRCADGSVHVLQAEDFLARHDPVQTSSGERRRP